MTIFISELEVEIESFQESLWLEEVIDDSLNLRISVRSDKIIALFISAVLVLPVQFFWFICET